MSGAAVNGAAIVVALALFGLGLRLVLAGTGAARTLRIARRMEALAAAGNVVAAARDIGAAYVANVRMPHGLQALFGQANLHPSRSLLLAVVLGDAAAAVLAGLLGGWFVGVLCAVVILGAELAVVRSIANRRLAQFTAELPIFLEKIVQLVKIGSSLPQALARASEASPPVVKEYFAPVLRRIENGAGVDEALHWLALRLDLLEFHMLVVTLEANLLHGGRLKSTIGFLVQSLRDRQRVDRELRAATSEGRATAWVVGALPLAVAAYEWFRFPDNLAYFLGTTSGHVMLAVALALEGGGVLLLNRLLKVSY